MVKTTIDVILLLIIYVLVISMIIQYDLSAITKIGCILFATFIYRIVLDS